MSVRYGSSGGSSSNVFTPGNTRYVDAVNGLDSNSGGPGDPFQTIGAAMSNIGSAANNTIFNTDATARWLVEVGPGVYIENVNVPTRQFIDVHLNNALISGNVTQTFDASVIGAGPIIQNKLIIRGDDLRAQYVGSEMPLSGVSGDITLTQTGSPTSFMQLYLMETGVGGNIIAQTGSTNFDCSVACVNVMVGGSIQTTSGTAITLYAAHCDESVSKSIGGISGAVTLYQMNNVTFAGPVVASGHAGGRWYNVVFFAGANDFTGYANTVSSDANSYQSFVTNVPTMGTVTFSLIDTALGMAYAPTTPGDWGGTVPTTIQQALDILAAR